jgi:GrpB-like predicted nucleotidyltransferase (UPF0157 family)
MNKDELGKLYLITIVQYDGNWNSLFQNERQSSPAFLVQKLLLRIEHIGTI